MSRRAIRSISPVEKEIKKKSKSGFCEKVLDVKH